jgi:hypothetical protein
VFGGFKNGFCPLSAATYKKVSPQTPFPFFFLFDQKKKERKNFFWLFHKKKIVGADN